MVNVTASEYPLIEQVITLGRCVAANRQLRKTVYLEVLSMSLAKSNFISLAFAEINHMVRSFEINHLILIDKYIFEEHPEFLKTVALRGLTERFSKAISFLRKYPADKQLYIKLLEDKDKCAQINRKVFSEAAIIATTIAEFKNSTFSNFYQSTDQSAKRLRELTTEYLELRYNLLNIAAGENETMGERESAIFFEKQLQSVERRYIESQKENSEDLNQLSVPILADPTV